MWAPLLLYHSQVSNIIAYQLGYELGYELGYQLGYQLAYLLDHNTLIVENVENHRQL